MKEDYFDICVEKDKIIWTCNDCGHLFGYPRFDQNSGKDRCPICEGSNITKTRSINKNFTTGKNIR